MTESYTEWRRARQCDGKRQWPNAKEARARARESADAYNEARAAWDHYHCPHCGYHHIGHTGATR